MRIRVWDYELQEAIKKASPVLPRKSSIGICESVLLVAKDNRITLTGYNLESGIVVEVNGGIEEEGLLLINQDNFKMIQKIKGEILIKSDKEAVTIKGNREIKVTQLNPEDYPKMDIETSETAFSITEKDFKDSLKIKAFAAIDQARPMLNGLCINKNRIAGLDGYRMGVIGLEIENQCKKDIPIPLKSISELDKILDKKSEKELVFKYSLDKEEKQMKTLTITGKDFTYVTKLYAGNYPDIDKIIPEEFKINVKMKKADLSEALTFANEISKTHRLNNIKFNITDEFTVVAESLSGDKQSKESITSDISGEELEIAFNNKYLVEALRIITDEEITLQLNKRTYPMVIQGSEKSNELYLVLPINLVARK